MFIQDIAIVQCRACDLPAPVHAHRGRRERAARCAWCSLSLSLMANFAHGTERGTSATGVAYASGGASDEELEALRAERLKYSFWLTTAARRSGAYLARVRVRINEAEAASVCWSR